MCEDIANFTTDKH